MALTTARAPLLRARQREIALALAAGEARRMIRNPLLHLGWVISALLVVEIFRSDTLDGQWSGGEYFTLQLVLIPVHVAIAVIVAGAFHRERDPVGIETPTDASTRAAGLLLGSLSLIGVVAALTVALGSCVALIGGLDLGDEPGRILDAQFSGFQLLQHVATAVLAVATGAAAGRRLAHLSVAALVLFIAWFPLIMGWWFQGRTLVAFSVIQLQPINVRVAPVSTDPLTLPSQWLLNAPNEFQDFWGRAFVSPALAGFHCLWLIGLSCLYLALVFDGRWRIRLLLGGVALAVVAIPAQFWLIP